MIKSLKFRRGLTDALIYILLIVLSVIWLSPIVWLVLQSFAGEGIAARAKFIPSTWTFNNYLMLFSNFTGLVNPDPNRSLNGWIVLNLVLKYINRCCS